MHKLSGNDVLVAFSRIKEDLAGNPSGKTIELITAISQDDELYVEFWRTLANPESLPWLTQHGFISAASLKQPIGSIQLAYLLRAVGHSPETVDNLMKGYAPYPDDRRAIVLILQIAIATSNTSLVPNVIECILSESFRFSGLTFPNLLGDLAKKLKQERAPAFHAVNLKMIASFGSQGTEAPESDDIEEYFKRSDQPDPKVGEQNYEYLRECCRALIACAPAHKDGPQSDLGTLSTLWLASFVDNEDNSSWDTKTALARSIVEFGMCICVNVHEGFPRAATIIKDHRYPIFDRIYLHLLGKYGSPAEIASVLGDQNRFDDITYKNEMANLFRAHFGETPTALQDKILHWIDVGPEDASNPAHADQWRLWKLSWIEKHLSGAHRERFENLKRRFGSDALTLADRNHHTSSGWGNVTPFSFDELSTASPAEVVARINEWAPTSDRAFRSPNTEGLANTFQQIVNSNAVLWSKHAMLVATMKPYYVDRAFSGWLTYAQGHSDLDWDRLLDLIESVLHRPQTSSVDSASNESAEPETDAWRWSKQSIAELIGKACGHEVSRSYFPRFISVLHLLSSESPESSVVDEDAFFARDHATGALNSIRGKVATALCDIIVWLGKADPAWKPQKGQFTGDVSRFAKIYAIIESHLADPRDENASAWAAYALQAHQLRWMNPSWFQENVVARLTLKQDLDSQRGPWAFWLTFLKFQQAHRVWLKEMRSCYEATAQWLSTREEEEQDKIEVISSFLEHLLVYYWQGDLRLQPGDILDQAFQGASTWRRTQAICFVGRTLRRQDAAPEEVVKRFHALWAWYWKQYGIADAQNRPRDKSDRRSRHGTFGDWFASGQLGAGWSLNRFKEYLIYGADFIHGEDEMERLDQWCSEYPLLVLEIITMLVAADAHGWNMPLWDSSVKSILSKTAGPHGTEIASARTALLETLVRRGHASYLQKSDVAT